MGKLFRKPTRQEKEARIRSAFQLLLGGAYKGEVKEFLKTQYGVSARTTERYLARARGLLREEASLGSEAWRSSAAAIHESILQDPLASRREMVVAQKRIDKLLCLEARS
jgi:hypothetical protein